MDTETSTDGTPNVEGLLDPVLSAEEVREQRRAFAKALTDIAQAILDHPELPVPHPVVTFYSWDFNGDDVKAAFKAFVGAFPGKKTKSYDEVWAEIKASVGPMEVRLATLRGAVCEKVVVGTKTETLELPDPVALASLQRTSVTVTEEIIEWRCDPFLAE